MRLGHRSYLDYLHAVTSLLQRIRTAHPTDGLYQAAEVQFWWSAPRRTDDLDQLFWFDDAGRPEAAAILVDFTGGSSLVYDEITFCPFVMPGAAAEHIAQVVDRGLAHAAEHGFTSVELEVDRADDLMRDALRGRGFAVAGDAVVEAWLAADDRPEISPLPDGYRLASRAETAHRPHPLGERNPRFDEGRLRDTSLYRPDLDLVILDSDGSTAAHSLFWHDPVTATGVVEPMRTRDEHQRRGLARHLLTSGVVLLAEAGAERISIGWEPGNAASGHLYRSVGFEAVKQTDLYAGPVSPQVSSTTCRSS